MKPVNLDNAHILICRTDNIGDVVLTLPLAGFPETTLSIDHDRLPVPRLCGADGPLLQRA